jgi:hypothetical protein
MHSAFRCFTSFSYYGDSTISPADWHAEREEDFAVHAETLLFAVAEAGTNFRTTRHSETGLMLESQMRILVVVLSYSLK